MENAVQRPVISGDADPRRARVLVGAVAAAGLLLLAVVWFWRFRSEPFVGDDLGLITTYANPDSSLGDLLTADHATNRWRPFADLTFTASAWIFGESFEAWWALNVVLLALTATVVGAVLWRVTSSFLIAGAAALLVITSRFVLYQVATATGQIEAWTTLFSAVFAAAGLMYLLRSREAWLWVVWLSFTLAMMTHERFQSLLLPALLLIWIVGPLSSRSKLAWSFGFLAPVLLLTLVKTQVFGLPLAVGTGTAQGVGFSWFSTWQHLYEGSAQIFGLNFGPAYLVGSEFNGGLVFRASAAVALVALTGLVVIGPPAVAVALETSHSKLVNLLRGGAFLVLTGLVVLGASVVTSNLQQRWLVAPYITLILFAASGVGYLVCRAPNLRAKYVVGSVAGAFLVVTLFLNIKYREGYDQLFFRGWQAQGTAQLSVLDQAVRESARSGSPTFVVEPSGNRTLVETLSQLYRGNSERVFEFILVRTPEDVTNRYPGAPIILVQPDGNLSRFR